MPTINIRVNKISKSKDFTGSLVDGIFVYDTNTGKFSILSDSGVTPGTYGDGSTVPIVTIDAKGRVTAITTASIPPTNPAGPTGAVQYRDAGGAFAGSANLTADSSGNLNSKGILKTIDQYAGDSIVLSNAGVLTVYREGYSGQGLRITGASSPVFQTLSGNAITFAAPTLVYGNGLGYGQVVISGAAGDVGQVIQGASGQTADAFQVKNSTGTVLAKIDANGNVTAGVVTASQDGSGGGAALVVTCPSNFPRVQLAGSSTIAAVFNRGSAGAGIYFGESADTGGYLFRGSGTLSTEGPSTMSHLGLGGASAPTGGIWLATPHTDLYSDNSEMDIRHNGTFVLANRANSVYPLQVHMQASPGSRVDVYASDAASVPLVLHAASGQTANAFQIKDSTGTVRTAFAAPTGTDNYLSLGIGGLSGAGVRVGANSSFGAYWGCDFSGTGLSTAASNIYPGDGTGGVTNGVLNLGTSGNRFATVYATAGNFTGTITASSYAAGGSLLNNSSLFVGQVMHSSGRGTRIVFGDSVAAVLESQAGETVAVLKLASGQTNDALQIKDSTGTTLARISATGTVYAKPEGTDGMSFVFANETRTGFAGFNSAILPVCAGVQCGWIKSDGWEIAGNLPLVWEDTTPGSGRVVGLKKVSAGVLQVTDGGSGYGGLTAGVLTLTQNQPGGNPADPSTAFLVLNNTNASAQTVLAFAVNGTAVGGVRGDYQGNFNWHASGPQGHEFYGTLDTSGFSFSATTSGLNVGGTAGAASTARLDVFCKTASKVGVTVQGASGQTADALQVKDSTGTALTVVDADGRVGVGTSSPSGMNGFNGSGVLHVGGSSPVLRFGGHQWCEASGVAYFQINGYTKLNVDANGKVAIGLGPTTATAHLHVKAFDASTVGQIIQLASGQTADAFQVKNSTGSTLLSVNADGDVNGLLSGTNLSGKYGLRANNGVVETYYNGSRNWYFQSAVMYHDGGGGIGFSGGTTYLFGSGGVFNVCNGTQVAGTGAVVCGQPSSSVVGLTVKLASGATANLTEWQNSTGTVGARITSAQNFSDSRTTTGYSGCERFGAGASTVFGGCTAVGYNAHAIDSSTVIGSGATDAAGSCVVIGFGASSTPSGYGNGVAVGTLANCGTWRGVAVGYQAAATYFNVAVGYQATAPNGGIALGYGATSNTTGEFVIGSGGVTQIRVAGASPTWVMDAADKSFIVKLYSGQTADAFQVKNSTGTVLSKFNSIGGLAIDQSGLVTVGPVAAFYQNGANPSLRLGDPTYYFDLTRNGYTGALDFTSVQQLGYTFDAGLAVAGPVVATTATGFGGNLLDALAGTRRIFAVNTANAEGTVVTLDNRDAGGGFQLYRATSGFHVANWVFAAQQANAAAGVSVKLGPSGPGGGGLGGFVVATASDRSLFQVMQTNASTGGWVGVNNSNPGAQLHVVADAATTVGVVINLASGQTADALQVKDSTGNVLVGVSAAGHLTILADGHTDPARGMTFHTGAGGPVWERTGFQGIAIGTDRNVYPTWQGGFTTGGFTYFGNNAYPFGGAYFKGGYSGGPSVVIETGTSTTVGLVTKLASLQSVDVAQVQDPSGTPIGAVVNKAGAYSPVHLADAAAPNDSLYYSTDAGKLCYKDSGGVVNNLY